MMYTNQFNLNISFCIRRRTQTKLRSRSVAFYVLWLLLVSHESIRKIPDGCMIYTTYLPEFVSSVPSNEGFSVKVSDSITWNLGHSSLINATPFENSIQRIIHPDPTQQIYTASVAINQLLPIPNFKIRTGAIPPLERWIHQRSQSTKDESAKTA